MEIVKKNIISIICGVVALAALGVAFTMVPSDRDALQAKLDQSKATHDSLSGLLTKSRQLPTVDPDNPTADTLKQFPNEKIIKVGEEITKKVEAESFAMRDAAIAMNKHVLLEPGSLPLQNTTAAFQFRTRYQQYFPAPNLGPLASQLAKDLNAAVVPTAEQMQQRANEEAQKIQTRQSMIDGAGKVINEEAVKQAVAEKLKNLPVQMREDIAKTRKVYINPTTFDSYPAILAAVGAPNPLDIYQAQVSLWMYQDVVAAVNDANRNAKSIMEAPVKHLIKVVAQPAFIMDATPPSSDPDAALPKNPQFSPTQRVGCGLYDVFHFSIDADVEAAKVVDFVRELSRNRLITARWWDTRTVDNAVELAEGRVYGPNPVVRVHIECETLFLRSWNAPLMPKVVRDRLQIQDAPPAGGAPAAPVAALAQ